MEKERGIVRIAKKPYRGAHPVTKGYLNVDASSGSMLKLGGQECRFAFSPMHLGPVVEKDLFDKTDDIEFHTAVVFENYWQYGKLFPGLKHIDNKGNICDEWFEFRRIGYAKEKGDRHPKGTKTEKVKYRDRNGRNFYVYMTATSSFYLGKQMGYIESRKKIYAPVYAKLVQETDAYKALKAKVDAGENVQILEIDAPDDNESYVVTEELMIKRINDPNVPFGHGNVLAALLANIDIQKLLV